MIRQIDDRLMGGCSIAEELAQVLLEIRTAQAQNLDHFVFREGGLTYHQLQHLDCLANPELYNKATGAAVAGPSSQFREDDQHQEGEEQEKLIEEEQEPLQHPLCTPELTQQEDSYNEIQISGESSQALNNESENSVRPIETPIVPFPNEEEWTLWLDGQLNRIFHLTGTYLAHSIVKRTYEKHTIGDLLSEWQTQEHSFLILISSWFM